MVRVWVFSEKQNSNVQKKRVGEQRIKGGTKIRTKRQENRMKSLQANHERFYEEDISICLNFYFKPKLIDI